MRTDTKLYAKYQTMLLDWGRLSNEYAAVNLEAKQDGWNDDIEERLNVIGKQINKLRGPLLTMVNKIARQMATENPA